MSRSLVELAEDAGLRPIEVADDELHATCPVSGFVEPVTGLARAAILSDLFATTDPGRPARLTAVLQLPADRHWLVVSGELEGDEFRSLTPAVHAASWYEREIREMHGLEPVGHPRPAPLRLHGWPPDPPPMRGHGADPGGVPARAQPSPMTIVQGQGVFELPLGPVRSGPQESAAFLFGSGGEDLVTVSPRLGYKFRAIERMAEGRLPDHALILAERLAGTSAFANALAFARAVERASGVVAGAAAEWTRTVLAEVERIRSHCAAIMRLADATGLLMAGAHYGLMTEELLRTAAALSGHRYLRGALRIGTAGPALGGDGARALRRRLGGWSRQAQTLRSLLAETSTFQDRLETTAVLEPSYAALHNLIGPNGRASGRDRDVRRDHPYAAYGDLRFSVPVRQGGDAAARLEVRLDEIDASFGLLEQLLEGGPAAPGPAAASTPGTGSALGWAEAPGGEALAFVELGGDGRVRRWRARPPAMVNWHPYAHACASGNNLTDYPVIEASFDLSVAEFDR